MGQEPRRAQHGRVPGHRAEAVEERAQQGRRATWRDHQQHHPAQHHVERAEHGGHDGIVRAQAEDRHERQEHDRRQGREGDLCPAGRDRQHVLEVVVLVRALDDRVGDLGTAVQECVGLPHEVVVEVVSGRVRAQIHAQRQDEQRQRHPHRSIRCSSRSSPAPGPTRGRRVGGGVGRHARAKLPHPARRSGPGVR